MKWIPCTWLLEGSGSASEPWKEIRIHRVVGILYPGEKFAVRNELGYVLAKSGEWEYEPMPSSRDREFLERCRFDTFVEAAQAVALLR